MPSLAGGLKLYAVVNADLIVDISHQSENHCAIVLAPTWITEPSYDAIEAEPQTACCRVPHMNVLIRIKRAVLAGRYAFSEKARIEMEADDLTELDVAESILNADAIDKRLRSTSALRNRRREYLYVIQSTNLDGLVIYTKGKLVEAPGIEMYYFLVSSKRAM